MMTPSSPRVRRTRTTLADGRDLFYFDDSPDYVSGAKTRRLDDPRPLTDRFTPILDEDGSVHPIVAPWMRRDPLTSASRLLRGIGRRANVPS